MPDFIPGLKLSELFYHEAVKPLLDEHFPHLQYSAALIGPGSEVLGFDDEMSTDHDWGPRLLVFLREGDYENLSGPLHETLSRKLPRRFRGYPTEFPKNDSRKVESAVINHRVGLLTLRDMLPGDVDPDYNREFRPVEWLTFPQHQLREITSGTVFHDEVGLKAFRDRFRYYPHDVWLYLLIASWTRIGQEQHLMGRAGFAGDELGSAIIGSRLAREVMRLGFLMEKQYAPYPKWCGTAFSRLQCGRELIPILTRAQQALAWQDRETHLCAAFEYIGTMHNALNITGPVSAQAVQFHNRPFRVIAAEPIIDALRSRITDLEVQRIADRWAKLGNIDQISDSPDFVMGFGGSRKLYGLYERDCQRCFIAARCY